MTILGSESTSAAIALTGDKMMIRLEKLLGHRRRGEGRTTSICGRLPLCANTLLQRLCFSPGGGDPFLNVSRLRHLFVASKGVSMDEMGKAGEWLCEDERAEPWRLGGVKLT